jgi:2-dehydro-3-deoxygluconokinase
VSEVVTLGECMAAFVALERGPMAEAATWKRTVAGAEANVAVGLVRLGHEVAFVGRVGDDGLGRAIVRHLRGEGVDVSRLVVDGGAATGVMFRDLRDVGAAEVVYWRRGSAGSRISNDDVDAAAGLLAGSRWLHVTGITPAISQTARSAVERAIEHARAGGVRVSLDLNIRRRVWPEAEAAPVLGGLVGRVDLVLGSLDEMAVVGGLAPTLEAGAGIEEAAAAGAVIRLGPSSAVVKLGPRGALEAHLDERGALVTQHRAAFAVGHVADAVGAGDAFAAGYLAAILEGRTIGEALETGNACGASAIASLGDQAGLPTRPELERLLGPGGPDVLR